MGAQKLTAAVLIVIGILVLAYGGFSYTKETHKADIGSVHMSIDEKEYVYLPVWVGVGTLMLGTILLIRMKS